MKRIVKVFSPMPSDATSFYRAYGPMSFLHHLTDKWQVSYAGNRIEWHDVANCDVMFFQRPCSKESAGIIEIAHSFNRKIWIDFDDLVFDVPISNPAHNEYMNQSTLDAISRSIKYADIITVSTQHLADRIISYGVDTAKLRVIPNAVNDYLHPWSRESRQNETEHKRFFWRGSNTHNEDLDFFLPVLSDLAKWKPDWKFMFCGKPSYKIYDSIPREQIEIVPTLNLVSYFNFLRSGLKASVALVPLIDSSFNRAKSNIAWQESTLAGCAAVVPAFDEWNVDGAVKYDAKNPQSFYEAIMVAVKNHNEYYEKSFETLKKDRMLSDINKMRLSILDQYAS